MYNVSFLTNSKQIVSFQKEQVNRQSDSRLFSFQYGFPEYNFHYATYCNGILYRIRRDNPTSLKLEFFNQSNNLWESEVFSAGIITSAAIIGKEDLLFITYIADGKLFCIVWSTEQQKAIYSFSIVVRDKNICSVFIFKNKLFIALDTTLCCFVICGSLQILADSLKLKGSSFGAFKNVLYLFSPEIGTLYLIDALGKPLERTTIQSYSQSNIIYNSSISEYQNKLYIYYPHKTGGIFYTYYNNLCDVIDIEVPSFILRAPTHGMLYSSVLKGLRKLFFIMSYRDTSATVVDIFDNFRIICEFGSDRFFWNYF